MALASSIIFPPCRWWYPDFRFGVSQVRDTLIESDAKPILSLLTRFPCLSSNWFGALPGPVGRSSLISSLFPSPFFIKLLSVLVCLPGWVHQKTDPKLLIPVNVNFNPNGELIIAEPSLKWKFTFVQLNMTAKLGRVLRYSSPFLSFSHLGLPHDQASLDLIAAFNLDSVLFITVELTGVFTDRIVNSY